MTTKYIDKHANIAAYLRKSRATQDSEDTLSQHRSTLTEFISNQEYSNVEWFEEIASGESIDHRPVFRNLLERISSGEFDAVLVVHEDRLSRGDQFEQGRIQRTFQEAGTVLLTPSGHVDFNDDDQIFQNSLKGLLSNHELMQIKRRMTSGKKQAVKNGRSHTGRVPFGYKWDKNTKTAVIDEEQARAYRFMVDSYVNKNMTLTQIAEKLEEMNAKTAKGLKRWTTSSVSKALNNRFHIGYVFHGRYKSHKVTYTDEYGQTQVRYNTQLNKDKSEYIETKGAHEPLKTEAEHALILEIFEKRKPSMYKDRRKVRNRRRLQSIIRCPYCKRSLNVYEAKKGLVYVQKCYSKNVDRKKECDTHTKGISENIIYEAVIEHLKQYRNKLFSPNENEDENNKKLNSLNQAIENYKSVISQSKGNIERSKNMAIEGLLDTEELKQVKNKEENKISNAQAEIDSLQKESALLEDLKSKQLKERFSSDEVIQLLEGQDENLDDETINNILRSIIYYLTFIRDENGNIKMNIRYN